MNRELKNVNNHKTKIYHTSLNFKHIISRDLVEIFKKLNPVYQEIDEDFQAIDMVDLIYYERWLNE